MRSDNRGHLFSSGKQRVQVQGDSKSSHPEWRAAPSSAPPSERQRPGEGRCWINLGGWQLVTNHSRK